MYAYTIIEPPMTACGVPGHDIDGYFEAAATRISRLPIH